MGKHRNGTCLECGRENVRMEMHNVCCACWNRADRAKKRGTPILDPHRPEESKENLRLQGSLQAMLRMFALARMTRIDKDRVKAIMAQYLRPILPDLDFRPTKREQPAPAEVIDLEEQDEDYDPKWMKEEK